MRKLHYHLVDVFTDRAFGGNPLAVFPNGRGVAAETMQAIAKELNLSETTFVLPSSDAQHDFRLRIFTPAVELPMAGHPTVGTVFVLAHERMIERTAGEQTSINLEEGVGTIPVTIEWAHDEPCFVEMRQPLPTFGPRFADAETIAALLSLEPEAITSTGLPLEVVSCGVPFLFVPVRGLAEMRRIKFRSDVWERALEGFATSSVFVFTTEIEHAGSTVHSRMFAPIFGIAEDPATGSASGPLGCYLARHGVVASAPEVEIVSEQGIEMGRPSFIRIRIEQAGGEITGVRVGGRCRLMGQGFLEIGD